MIRIALSFAMLAGCVTSGAAVCSDGRLCPIGTACDEVHKLCVEPDQLAACTGVADATPCMTIDVTGLCQGGVCLATVCGDGVVELGEACDDGNTNDGDGCSQTCLSDETCGNHVVDILYGEQCDDGNHVDHDGCASTCLVETPHWIERSIAPAGRYLEAIAYDAQRDRAVMFSGIDNNGAAFVDTWEWNGGEWLRPPVTTTPQLRVGAGLVYDAALGKAVLFGGVQIIVLLDDTWAWDGARWEPINVPAPPGRFGHVMVYDSKRKRVVLFGGVGSVSSVPGQIGVLNDTWEFDGTWHQITTAHAPAKRELAAATYDPHRGVVVLVGGFDNITTTFADTWEYDGTDWRDVTPSSGPKPQVREAAIGYDVLNQRVLVYGGRNGAIVQSTTWAWNGTAWTNVLSGTPTARTQAAMAQTNNGLVLFGGNPSAGPSLNETWTWTGNAWQQAKDPGPRAAFAMIDDPRRARGLVYGGYIDSVPTRVGDTWELTHPFTLRAGPPPAPRGAPCIAYDRTRDEFVMFGGSPAAGGELAETWVWKGSGWAQRMPAASPSGRKQAACAWNGRNVILVGGMIAGTPQADAWKWDGTTWTKLTDFPAASAGPVFDAAAGYDPIRNQLVVFGGAGAGAPTDTTIVYDGTTWQVPALDFRPPSRIGATLTWNPARGALVLVGGLGGGFGEADSYEWDGAHWHVIPAIAPPPGRYDHGAMTSLDGGGVLIYGGINALTGVPTGDRWELRWDADAVSDRCDASDLDHDGLTRCADPDCWRVCAPSCPPGTTCVPGAQTCGDSTCNAGPETCRTCPEDCGACTPTCGDGICDPGETSCPGDCP